ncbi:MAG TPA: manganese efflux pump [Streptosporangiaceae bacterium]|nr:manganese efflux pump [Streptosporangiaceae bacterium]
MLALALVAVSVGFSNLAASIGLGVGGVTMATRIRVLLAFGLFEAAMPIIGLLIGANVATSIGRQAKWIGAALLIAVGCYGIVTFIRSVRAPREQAPAAARKSSGGRREWLRVGISAFALSIDNLIVGFALGSYQVNLLIGALVFGFVSIAMSLLGLEFGARLGGWVGDSGEMIGGIVLVGVGLAIGFGMLG